MRIQGKVHAISSRGELIARFPTHIPEKTVVVDNRRNAVGRVSWIFGPVLSPYVEITCSKTMKRPLTMMDRPVFVEED